MSNSESANGPILIPSEDTEENASREAGGQPADGGQPPRARDEIGNDDRVSPQLLSPRQLRELSSSTNPYPPLRGYLTSRDDDRAARRDQACDSLERYHQTQQYNPSELSGQTRQYNEARQSEHSEQSEHADGTGRSMETQRSERTKRSESSQQTNGAAAPVENQLLAEIGSVFDASDWELHHEESMKFD